MGKRWTIPRNWIRPNRWMDAEDEQLEKEFDAFLEKTAIAHRRAKGSIRQRIGWKNYGWVPFIPPMRTVNFDTAPWTSMPAPNFVEVKRKGKTGRGIEIEAEKVVKDRICMWKIASFQALPQSRLPQEYTYSSGPFVATLDIGPPTLCVRDSYRKYNLRRGATLTDKEFHRMLGICRAAGERLHQINAAKRDRKKRQAEELASQIREGWTGTEVFSI